MRYLIILLIGVVVACNSEEFCDCEIFTDDNTEDITFVVKGCHFCCKAFTVRDCNVEIVDEIGEAWYQSVISRNRECVSLEEEDNGWYWIYGSLK